MKEDITKRIDNLNDELKVRQGFIDLLRFIDLTRLKSQITSFKETIAKVLDKDTTLAEKIRTLFREQGIKIASILTAIGMAIGYLSKHYYQVVGVVVPRHQVANHLLKLRPV